MNWITIEIDSRSPPQLSVLVHRNLLCTLKPFVFVWGYTELRTDLPSGTGWTLNET